MEKKTNTVEKCQRPMGVVEKVVENTIGPRQEIHAKQNGARQSNDELMKGDVPIVFVPETAGMQVYEEGDACMHLD